MWRQQPLAAAGWSVHTSLPVRQPSQKHSRTVHTLVIALDARTPIERSASAVSTTRSPGTNVLRAQLSFAGRVFNSGFIQPTLPKSTCR